jgi:hypothetical protein
MSHERCSEPGCLLPLGHLGSHRFEPPRPHPIAPDPPDVPETASSVPVARDEIPDFEHPAASTIPIKRGPVIDQGDAGKP